MYPVFFEFSVKFLPFIASRNAFLDSVAVIGEICVHFSNNDYVLWQPPP